MNEFAIKVLAAPLGETHLFAVGQAGYIIKSKSGQLLAIDLYLSECVERVEHSIGFKRLLPKILAPFDLDFDVVICTHDHRDHFDIDSVPELMSNGKTRLYASKNCKKSVKQLEMDESNVEYVKPGDKYLSGDFQLDFINCDHGESAPDAVGVIISVDDIVILEVGDTCLRLDRIKEYLIAGNIDILIAPINGAYGNLNEEECIRLADALDAKITIPCHYGMFASHGGNLGRFCSIVKEYYANRNILIMAQGEKYTVL